MARIPQHRIREARERLGLTQAQLGERMGVSEQQVARYERGDRRLTIQMMARFAATLNVTPAELVAGMPVGQEDQPELEIATVDGVPGLMAAIATRGLKVYRVRRSLVTDAGIVDGQIITVDESDEAKATAKTGDIVVAGYQSSDVMILRQYVAPSLLVTNMPGPHNDIIRLDDVSVRARILGVVIKS